MDAARPRRSRRRTSSNQTLPSSALLSCVDSHIVPLLVSASVGSSMAAAGGCWRVRGCRGYVRSLSDDGAHERPSPRRPPLAPHVSRPLSPNTSDTASHSPKGSRIERQLRA
jgi:hypothetical protein